MKAKQFLSEFILVFVISLLVTIIITFIWNILFHNTNTPNWETSFQLSIIFAIILPLSKLKSK